MKYPLQYHNRRIIIPFTVTSHRTTISTLSAYYTMAFNFVPLHIITGVGGNGPVGSFIFISDLFELVISQQFSSN
jgi:hypothetical protein